MEAEIKMVEGKLALISTRKTLHKINRRFDRLNLSMHFSPLRFVFLESSDRQSRI